MVLEHLDIGLDQVRQRKLVDLAKWEGTSDLDMLRRLIDRAYEADQQTHAVAKPKGPPDQG